MKRKPSLYVTTVLITALLLSGFTCTKGTQRLAIASDAVSHALVNADAAANQAVASGVITAADRDNFHAYLVTVSKAGLVLDQGIRANESATTLSLKVNSFLDAFNALSNQGLIGIKDNNTKIALSTILNGAESAVAIIAATTGGK